MSSFKWCFRYVLANISPMAYFFLTKRVKCSLVTTKTTQPRPQVFSVKDSIWQLNFTALFQLLY